jgi:hypothetical protein
MKRERHKIDDRLHEDMRRWRQLLQRLPAVRTDKVAATREAIRRNAYDDEHILSETIARMRGDLEALCDQKRADG